MEAIEREKREGERNAFLAEGNNRNLKAFHEGMSNLMERMIGVVKELERIQVEIDAVKSYGFSVDGADEFLFETWYTMKEIVEVVANAKE